MKKLGKILLLALCLCVVVCVILYIFRPHTPYVTIPEIERGANGSALVKLGEGYYELQASDSFAELFAFDEWEQTQNRPSGNPAIMFRFAEEWIVEIYSDGAVSAYYGYASLNQKSSAYYIAPAEIIEALSSFVEENGVPQEGQFLESAFLH